jgi:hypothetical protein
MFVAAELQADITFLLIPEYWNLRLYSKDSPVT